jgi:DNA polymerase-3 subunit delta'
MLVDGPQGVGKRDFAEAFAASLLCGAPDGRGLACGKCKGCLLLKAGTHPDLHVIAPEEPGKDILVAAIREHVQRAGLASQLGGFKVTLIEPADAMNTSATNSLLKTLDEPVPWTLMILITAQASRMLATIRSRCQRLQFTPPDNAQALAWLAQQGVADGRLLLGMAGGAPLRALALNDDGVLAMRRESLSDFLALLEGRGDAVEIAGRWEKQDLERLFYWMSGWLIDILGLSSGGARSPANPDMVERFATLAARLDGRALFTLLDKVHEGRRGLRGSLNTRLLLEDLLLSVVQCAKVSGGNR